MPPGVSASPGGFEPPFCPNPDCPFHCCTRGWRFRRIGFFTRRAEPSRIQRYQCRHCRRAFSTQTFSTTYWLRRPDLLRPVFFRLLACSGFRQIAREFAVSHTTILGQSARLGRHCLLFQHHHRPRSGPTEPLVLDGFESFEFSQYHPCHFHVVVGQESHFFYSFTDSELRRKGSMTDHQKDRRSELELRFGRPDPRSIELEVAQALRLVVPPGSPTELHSDDHPAYPRALKRLAEHCFHHRVTPGSAARTTANALFPANLLDLLIRHGSANHKRETIAFSKRRQSAIERLAVLQVWRNFIKPFSERRRNSLTPAERLGLCERRLAVAEVLQRRLLPSQVRLPERLERYYRREVSTRRIPRGVCHRLRYAD
jgi:transposase-like protein